MEGDGRSKPDVIGPRGQTSFTTPVVAAVAARLVEAGAALGPEVGPRAIRPETIKSVVMAGALKSDQWSQPPDRPLHNYLGAGVVNLDRSLRIMQGQVLEPGEAHTGSGWSLGELGLNEQADYGFEIENASDAQELSLVLSWHRRIEARTVLEDEDRPRWQARPRSAQFELRLVFVAPNGREGVIARSASEPDNVQHIHVTNLPAGTYRVEVERADDEHDEPWRYALAAYWGEHELFED